MRALLIVCIKVPQFKAIQLIAMATSKHCMQNVNDSVIYKKNLQCKTEITE